MQADTSIPSTGEAKTAGPLELSGQPPYTIYELHVHSENVSQKIWWKTTD